MEWGYIWRGDTYNVGIYEVKEWGHIQRKDTYEVVEWEHIRRWDINKKRYTQRRDIQRVGQ